MSELRKIQNNKKDLLMVFFGGMNSGNFGGVPPFEFLNFTTKHFPEVNALYYIDSHGCFYRKGFEGLTHDIDSSVEYLRSQIKDYKRVIFLGHSAGGYASLLFGSILKVDSILALGPQTLFQKKRKYSDIVPLLNEKTKYTIYTVTAVDKLHSHDHVRRIEQLNRPNIKCYYNDKPIKQLRDDGDLIKILNSVVYDS